MEETLQYKALAQRLGIPTTGTGDHHPDGPQPSHALTIKTDHSGGTDQTEQKTFDELDLTIGKDFYLLIDDGLHVPNAKLRSFAFFMTHVQQGGWIIVEDIGEAALSVWMCVSSILRDRFDCYVIKPKSAYMLCARKL